MKKCKYCSTNTHGSYSGDPCCIKCYAINSNPLGVEAGKAIWATCESRAIKNKTTPDHEFYTSHKWAANETLQ